MMRNKNISFIDLSLSKEEHKKYVSKISRLIKTNSFIGGDEVENFQTSFSSFNKSKFCLGVANGTDAIEIALESLGIPKNSEVIVPNFTFLSPAEAVLRGGYKLVLADINLDDFTICTKSLKKLVSKKTSAIIVVHLFGNPCQMDEILKIAKSENLKLIEDCSQSHGAQFKNTYVGNFGDIGTFSFYPTKNLGAFGDAGAIVTNQRNLYEKAKKIANHGRVKNYDHIIAGRNSRLDSIQAYVLNQKIEKLNEYNEIRISLASYYSDNMHNEIQGIKLNKNQKSVFHQFPILTKKRDLLMNYLNNRGINTGVYYPKPLSKMKAFQNNHENNDAKFINSDKASKEILSIPIGPHLKIKDAEYVSNAIQSFFSK